MSKFRQKVYDFIVRKNKQVQYEYERYVMEHTVEHHEHRLLHWKILLKLKWHFQVKRNQFPLLFWDVLIDPGTNATGIKLDKKIESYDNIMVNKVNIEKRSFANTLGSKLSNRVQVQHFANRFMNYDIISFDVYDTLVFRPFCEPADLFMLLEDELQIIDFSRIRVEAEREVRRLNLVRYGNRECTLEDIYTVISQRTGLKKEEGINAEIELELRLSYANPYMQHLFKILSAKKKRIIITSDMYLSEDVVRRVLEKCGYNCDAIENVFVSTEYNVSKSNGKLFDTIRNCYPDEKIVHVGDNLEVDIKKAREHSINAIHYPKCVDMAKFFYGSMSPLIGSAYRGIVANHISNGNKVFSAGYEHGFIYGGILVLGYVSWVYRQAKERGIEKILFVSRDGKVFKNVFDRIYPDIQTEYIYWSRIAHLNSCAPIDRDIFFQRYIRDKSHSEDITIKDLLEAMDLKVLVGQLKKYRLREQQVLNVENAYLVEKMVSDNWHLVEKGYTDTREFEANYFREIIGEARKIAIVDIGWTGVCLIDLKKFLTKYVNSDLLCSLFMMAITPYYEKGMQNLILNDDIEIYAFSTHYNRDLYKAHRTTNKRSNNVFFEILSQDSIPSYKGFRDGKLLFDIPEVENYDTIKEIHKGIYDFVDVYQKFFKKYKFMYNISGADAVSSIISTYGDVNYYKTRFGDFCFKRSVISSNKYAIETLIDICNRNGI